MLMNWWNNVKSDSKQIQTTEWTTTKWTLFATKFLNFCPKIAIQSQMIRVLWLTMRMINYSWMALRLRTQMMIQSISPHQLVIFHLVRGFSTIDFINLKLKYRIQVSIHDLWKSIHFKVIKYFWNIFFQLKLFVFLRNSDFLYFISFNVFFFSNISFHFYLLRFNRKCIYSMKTKFYPFEINIHVFEWNAKKNYNNYF